MDVVNYFLNTWINLSLSTWYEGASNFASTNNGLESRNAELKKITLRKKLGLAEFMKTVESTMDLWSTRPEKQYPAEVPKITYAEFAEAYEFKKGLEQSDVMQLHKFADSETHILVF
uniref:Transposase n=1 Tax=Ditylenchus dipsaci TaxID=166011 RepID=A0A915ELR4_9BILA